MKRREVSSIASREHRPYVSFSVLLKSFFFFHEDKEETVA